MPPRVVCFGAAHVDIQARAFGAIIASDSNPVRTTRRHGGVARNVAAWLARLGCDVSLITRLGTDPEGDGVHAGLVALGIGCAGISRSATAATASYTAALDPAGELHVGLADMAIYDELKPALLDAGLTALGGADAWFIDTNLPAPVIAHLAGRIPTGILFAADTVSVAKAARLRGACSRLSLLVTNTAEAPALIPSSSPTDAASKLHAAGIEHVVIGCGASGVLHASGNQVTSHPSLPARVADVTGAGDALAAGLLFAMLSGRPMDQAIQIAMTAAAWAVESETPLPESAGKAALLERARIGL